MALIPIDYNISLMTLEETKAYFLNLCPLFWTNKTSDYNIVPGRDPKMIKEHYKKNMPKSA